MSKVIIIYNINEKADVSDIMIRISEKIGETIPSINFLKKSQRKLSSNYNYVTELPQYIANFLTNAKTIKIKR